MGEMSRMSREMIQNNLVQWLDDIVTGVKASQRFVQCVSDEEVKKRYESYGRASIMEENSILLHGFKFVVDVLQPEVGYAVRQFWLECHEEAVWVDTPKFAKFFVYKDVYFFDYLDREDYENERSENENLVPLEELPVLNF